MHKRHKIDVPNSITNLDETNIFERHAIRCVSMNGNQRDMCIFTHENLHFDHGQDSNMSPKNCEEESGSALLLIS